MSDPEGSVARPVSLDPYQNITSVGWGKNVSALRTGLGPPEQTVYGISATGEHITITVAQFNDEGAVYVFDWSLYASVVVTAPGSGNAELFKGPVIVSDPVPPALYGGVDLSGATLFVPYAIHASPYTINRRGFVL